MWFCRKLWLMAALSSAVVTPAIPAAATGVAAIAPAKAYRLHEFRIGTERHTIAEAEAKVRKFMELMRLGIAVRDAANRFKVVDDEAEYIPYGWIHEQDLTGDAGKLVRAMTEGQVAGPVHVAAGVSAFWVERVEQID